jgi:hypothetical protein
MQTRPHTRRTGRTAARPLVTWLALVGTLAAMPVGAALAADSGASLPLPEAQRNALTCGHLGLSCEAEPERDLRLRVTPRVATAHVGTRFRVQVTVLRDGRRVPARSATVNIGARTVRTDDRGQATIVARFQSAGVRHAVARDDLAASATVAVRVR